MFWGLHIPFGESVVLKNVLRSIRITGAVLLRTLEPLSEDAVVLVYVSVEGCVKPVSIAGFDHTSGRRLLLDLTIDEGEAVTFTTNVGSLFGDGVDLSGYYVDKEDDDHDHDSEEDEVDNVIYKMKNKCFLKFLQEHMSILKDMESK